MTKDPFDFDSHEGPRADGIPVYCSHSDIVETGQLVPNPRNPNQHPEEQIKMLAKVIKHQGWRAPITVSKRSGFIVRGHGRLAAALALGKGEVPVDFQEYDSDAAEWADLIADNRLAELSEIDKGILKDVLEELNVCDDAVFDMELTGYSNAALESLMSEFYIEDETDEAATDDGQKSVLHLANVAIEPPKHLVGRGDKWKLGNHVLICADVLREWSEWVDYLTEDSVFCPFPGPFVPLSELAQRVRLVMVQPDQYICGHIIDRYVEIHGDLLAESI